MREYLKAIIWPRDQNPKIKTRVKSKDGKKVYRYAIVGILVTDTKLNLGDNNEVLIDGSIELGKQLESADQRSPKIATGDATTVLLSLEDL